MDLALGPKAPKRRRAASDSEAEMDEAVQTWYSIMICFVRGGLGLIRANAANVVDHFLAKLGVIHGCLPMREL